MTMTQTEQQNVPDLRFPEFGGEWDNKKLGSIATFSKGKGISKADVDENGTLECIRYGQLYTDYAETIREVKSRTNVPATELVLSEANDIIIPASGETQIDIATASCVLNEGIALGGDLNIVKAEADGVFLSYYLNSKRKIDIARLSQGISVVHLYAAQLKLLHLNLPNKPEQQKIASFLSAVDSKIELLGKKSELLRRYKKGCMQKLFSQQLRFKDDQGNDFPDWEEKRLGDVLKIGSGRDYKHLGPGNIPVYGTGGYMTSVDEFLHDGESVCIGRKGTIDKPVYLTGKFWTVDTLFFTHSFSSSLPKFIYAVFQTINWKKHNEASGVPSLSKTTIERIKLDLPSLSEQQKIANFLSAIDQKIDLVATELDHAKAFKKGLLQQMFV